MRKYNGRDVELLERIYLRLRPWMRNHPNLSWFTKDRSCPACQSTRVQHRGVIVTRTGYRHRLHCQDCGAWSSDAAHVRVT